MTSDCDCEEWEEKHGAGGFFHTIEQYGIDAEAEADEVVVHRHTRPIDCNICTWLNESDILECADGNIVLEIGVTPIEPLWASPGYDWKPA
jgi:hypothetical protein